MFPLLFKSRKVGISSQDGGKGKHGSCPHTTTAKITTKVQSKLHPELSENRDVWKSDKHGIKEVIFMQTGRRDRDVEMWRHGTSSPVPMCGG